MTKYTIYFHTCRISDKSYIGYTKSTMIDRWDAHVYDAFKKNSTFAFHRALRKYGIENFDHQILEECCDLASAKRQEIFWIAVKKSFENGYNMTKGGDSPPIFERTLKYKENHRKATSLGTKAAYQRVEVQENVKKSFTVQRRANISQKQKEVQNRDDVRSPKCKSVLQVDVKSLQVIAKFDSACLASRVTNISQTHIHGCASGKRRIAGGYFWFFEGADIENRFKKTNAKAISQFAKNGDFVANFQSIHEAQIATGIRNISRCASGKTKFAGGFAWKWIT